jgi:hypothetical protein
LGDSGGVMLNYEDSRTEEIIDRLLQVSNAASSMLIILCCLGGIAFFGGLGTALGAASGDGDGVVTGGIIGSVVGVIIGWQGAKFWSAIITGTVEWMAQSLIAQGETLDQLKKNSE